MARVVNPGILKHKTTGASTTFFAVFLLWIVSANLGWAQTADRVAPTADFSPLQVLPDHHPKWASPANDKGPAPDNLAIENLTIVLARSPKQEQAFEQFLKDQQDRTSPEFHHWLTSEQIGERFGLSGNDIDTLSGWLTSQGLHVNWVAPSRIFINFGGTAKEIGKAFHTTLRLYSSGGRQRMSVSSDPMIPARLAPLIKAVRGLSSIEDEPGHNAASRNSSSPEFTVNQTEFVIVPGDFARIYDLPLPLGDPIQPTTLGNLTGVGVTIGIVGRSRTNMDDFQAFNEFTQSTIPDPTEIIPTAYGGVDPGPAETTQVSNPSKDQTEATLDVTRAGSVAPGANLLLVVSAATNAGPDGIMAGGDGIDAAAAYLVHTSPIPAQIMTISFSECESAAGSATANFWDPLFSQAVAEGISVFVSSGDDGAAGCDAGQTPVPNQPAANSPNSICSSSFATCVGGTEFNYGDIPFVYYSQNNSPNLSSAFGYIPEGAWNDSTTEPGNCPGYVGPCALSSGGGVSTIIPTPSWQKGVSGVPTAYSGRYTPDIAFAAEPYLFCFAAGGGACSVIEDKYSYEVAEGTSATAPSMAGIAALLDQQLGGKQGNLNPGIYATYASTPSAFHDVTVATSGVSSCDLDIFSMCNNSTPTGTGGAQAGYQVGTGFDEVTGLGSLDVSQFIQSFVPITVQPGFTLSPSPATLSIAQGGAGTSTITLTDVGGFSGSVTLAVSGLPSGVTSTFANGSVADTAILTLTATSSAAVTSSPVTVSLTGTSGALTATTTIALTITAEPAFAGGSGGTTAISVSPGATSGNTGTVSVAGTNGFTGTVALSCSVTTAITNASDMPTCSLSPGSVTISGSAAQNATLTVSTTSAATANGTIRNLVWPQTGGIALALAVFFTVPKRRRQLLALAALFALLASSGLMGCGGGSSQGGGSGGGGGGGGGGNPGTTAGAYTITVTGTSGAISATIATITLTVE